MTDDEKTADQMMQVVALVLQGGEDAKAGARALLREIRERHPGEIEAAAATIQLRRLGLRTASNRLPA